MEPTYQPKSIESTWRSQWQAAPQMPAGASSQKEPYCIMLPPPNVTGTLHMGHGFQQTLMDALMRYHTMTGHNTWWQAGTDHAGIATQMVVERQLAKKGLDRVTLGRDAFLEHVWQWKEQSGATITHQVQRLGASLNWQQGCFTMDEHMSHATREAFIRLHKDGLIYKGKRLVNWDPVLQTAVSDLEVVNEAAKGHLWYMRYPLQDEAGYLVVATTRPETLFGDQAVAVHPDDKRYQHLIGKKVQLPLSERTLPIVADSYVDPEFGSGCVKITPAHDFNDFEMGQRHRLKVLDVMNKDATMNQEVPKAYQGLDRFVARKKVIADLQSQGLIEDIKDHDHMLPKGDRSGAVLEPRLTDQWFVKMAPLAEPALAAVKSGKLTFVPENWQKTYFNWLESIQDWCISRQLWWGHRIPAWYDDSGNCYVGHNEAEVRKEHHLSADITLKQEEDVLDTWFTSALFRFASLGWPHKNSERLATYYPTSVLVTGFDIIFFWVARMVMMGLYFMGEVPFKTVYITGLIRDQQGQKMSKSKGNVLDPLDIIDGIALEQLIEKRTLSLMQPKMAASVTKATKKAYPQGIEAYGTDALRFSFCALASTGRDIRFDLQRTNGYRNFCNKIWNASRFVLMHTEHLAGNHLPPDASELSLADRWMRHELEAMKKLVTQHFTTYRFDLLAQVFHEVLWDVFCDWYLECAKIHLNEPTTTPAQKYATVWTLLDVLEQLLRMLHPLMPFITESIWQNLAPHLRRKTSDFIINQPYPSLQPADTDPVAKKQIDFLQQIVGAVRKIRSESGVSPAKIVSLIAVTQDPSQKKNMESVRAWVEQLSKTSACQWQDANAPLPVSASASVLGVELHIPLADLIDPKQEMARIEKKRCSLEKEATGLKARLANVRYLEQAPADVVAESKDKLATILQQLVTLTESQSRLQDLI